MTTVALDRIATHYQVIGSRPPLLMYSPGGSDATIEKWSTQGIYAQFKPLEHLSNRFSCIVFERPETGRSGGRLECDMPLRTLHALANVTYRDLFVFLGLRRCATGFGAM